LCGQRKSGKFISVGVMLVSGRFWSAPTLDITEQIVEATLKVRKKSRASLLYERSFEHDWTVLA